MRPGDLAILEAHVGQEHARPEAHQLRARLSVSVAEEREVVRLGGLVVVERHELEHHLWEGGTPGHKSEFVIESASIQRHFLVHIKRYCAQEWL